MYIEVVVNAALKIEEIKEVQAIAKKSMLSIGSMLRPGMTEDDIAVLAKEVMYSYGAENFWYHGIPAMVFCGENTSYFSRFHFTKAIRHELKEDDILWIDLAPAVGDAWGDFTRTIILSRGRLLPEMSYKRASGNERIKEFALLAHDIKDIQQKIFQEIKEGMTFGDIWRITLEGIEEQGYSCPDTRNNFGHTLPGQLSERKFIVRSAADPINDMVFAHELQIAEDTGIYGARIEDILHMECGELKVI